MLQYRSSPIYIVYSKHWQDYADDQWGYYYKRGDSHMALWMAFYTPDRIAIDKDAGTGRAQLEIMDDSAPAYQGEAAVYAQTIRSFLDSIGSTVLGQCLFGMLNPKVKIYIVPSTINLTAYTTPILTGKRGDGIRLHITPEDFKDEAEETLVHELTHAMRFSNGRFNPRSLNIGDFPDTEEFLATEVENIYRSMNRKRGLHQIYGGQLGQWSNKGNIYGQFISNPEFIRALKWCLDSEGLARQLAQVPVRQADFNPFRDFPVLEQHALSQSHEEMIRMGVLRAGSAAGKFIYLDPKEREPEYSK
jgi:hypothetical protein